MAVDVRLVPCLADNYAVILREPSTGATAVIDAPEADPILHALNQADWRLTHILVTHKHGDHVQGIPVLKQRYGATVIGPRAEAKEIPAIDIKVGKSDRVEVGKLRARVFEAPGHKSRWVGAIRRMHRDEQGHTHAGVEILSKKPLSVYFRGIGEGAERADNWQTSSGSFEFTFVNAIILGESATSGARHEVLLKRDGFTPGLIYEVMMGEQAPNVRLEELLDRGDDYDRVRVTWLKRGA